MSLTAKYNHAFEGNVALSAINTATKGRIMAISPVQSFGGADIIDSVKPFSKAGVYIIGELAGDAKAAGSGALTIKLYSADSTNGSTALTEVDASFGPFTAADINAGEFLRVALPEHCKGCIQLEYSGTNFSAGAVRIRVEA